MHEGRRVQRGGGWKKRIKKLVLTDFHYIYAHTQKDLYMYIPSKYNDAYTKNYESKTYKVVL